MFSTATRTFALSALAVPFAAAITLGSGVAAHASEAPTPELVPASVHTLDAELLSTPPKPVGPVGPDDIALPPSCHLTDDCPVDPEDDPVDPEVNPDIPEGPGEFTDDTGCEVEDLCGGGDDPTDPGEGDGEGEPEDGGDAGEDEPEVDDSTDTDTGDTAGTDGFDKPTRIDAGGLTTVGSGATGTDGGSQLAWLLPGGLLVGAAGAAGAARRIRTAAQRG